MILNIFPSVFRSKQEEALLNQEPMCYPLNKESVSIFRISCFFFLLNCPKHFSYFLHQSKWLPTVFHQPKMGKLILKIRKIGKSSESQSGMTQGPRHTHAHSHLKSSWLVQTTHTLKFRQLYVQTWALSPCELCDFGPATPIHESECSCGHSRTMGWTVSPRIHTLKP